MRNTRSEARSALRAVIYCRVSKDDERNGRSVGEQESECRDSAEDHGYSVSMVFPENDRSASRLAAKDRPEYKKLLQYLEAHNPDVLILWESSRGSREPVEWFTLLALCRTKKISMHIVKDRRTYDLGISRDWKNLAEDGIDSAYEVEKTHDRVLRAMTANAKNGKPHGKVLYGYAREYEQNGDHRKFLRQVIVESEAAIIREATNRVAMGETPYAIVKDFNARGIPAPRSATWDISKVRNLITNPAYIGKRIHIPSDERKKGTKTGTLVDAVWPAILDETIWQTCVDKFADPTRKTHRDTAIKHLLSGIATCGVCNSIMRVQNNNDMAYVCLDKFCVSVPAEKLDKYVSEKVRQRLISVTLAELDDPDQEAKRQAAKAEIVELQGQLDEARQQYLRPAPGTKRLSAVMLAQIESELEPQIQELQRDSRSSRVLPIVAKLVAHPEKWDTATLPEKREFLKSGSVIDGIDVVRCGKGQRKPVEERVEIEWTETRLSRNPE